MQKLQYQFAAIICALACLLGTAEAQAKRSAPKSAEQSQRRQLQQKSGPVATWFNQYDQIRRDAEATNKDKYQALFLAGKKPDKNNAALASRMIEKYTIAIAAMNQLQSIPETTKLQEGYTEYFSSAHQLFEDYRKAQNVTPFTNKALIPARKKLAVLDKANKRLDAQLRKKYKIAKHKHS